MRNKFGNFIGYTSLTATQSDTGDQITFTAGRGGGFSVTLSDGIWTITTDSEQTWAWGYGPLDNYQVTVSGDIGIRQDIVLYAREPLAPPTVEIYMRVFGDLGLTITGQGGTRLTVERSYDLKSWHTYLHTTLAKPGLSTNAGAPANYAAGFFRAWASTE